MDAELAVEFIDEERSLGRLDEFGFMLVPLAIGIAFALLIGPIAQTVQPDAWAVGNAAILFSMAMMLSVLWYKAPTDERRLFARVGKGLFPVTPAFTVPLIVVALVGMTLLMVTSFQPVVFAVLMLGIKLVESWNTALATPFITQGLGKVWAAKELPAVQRRRNRTLRTWKLEADAIETFYFKHKWYQLAVAEGVAIGLAATLAAYAMRDPDANVRHMGLLIATIALAVAMLANEVVNAWWRGQRDKTIAALSPNPLPGPTMTAREREEARRSAAR